MTKEFHITPEMIQGGVRGTDTGCPIGLALRAGGVTPVCVGFNFVECMEEGRKYVLPIPRAAFEFLKRSDAGDSVAPVRFKLTFVDPPRPLPERFSSKPHPKAHPLPVPLNGTSVPTIRKAVSQMVRLFTF